MKLRTLVILTLVLGEVAIASAGCVTVSSVKSNVANRAAVDFDCTATRIDVTPISGGSYRARGCGRSAVYVLPPGSTTPILNSQVTSYTETEPGSAASE